MQPEDRLEVERLGGLAGFGGPGAHLRSLGCLQGHELAAADREQLAALFAGTPAAPEPHGAADGFRYRLALHRPGSVAPVVIELPEAAVPPAVRDCVSDELV